MSIKDRLMTYAEVLEHEPMKKHTTFKIGGLRRLLYISQKLYSTNVCA